MRQIVKRFRSYWLQDISFVTLLLMLGFTIFIVPTFQAKLPEGNHLQSTMFLILFFVGTFSSYTKSMLFVTSMLFITGLTLAFIQPTNDNETILITMKIVFALNTLAFIYNNFKLLFRDEEFNFERVLGAVNVYLLIALLGAFLFELIQLFFDSSIKGEVVLVGTDRDFAEYIYFSFVSLTTVGFGEIFPANQSARMLSVFLSTIGILFPAIVIARLVSLGKTK